MAGAGCFVIVATPWPLSSCFLFLKPLGGCPTTYQTIGSTCSWDCHSSDGNIFQGKTTSLWMGHGSISQVRKSEELGERWRPRSNYSLYISTWPRCTDVKDTWKMLKRWFLIRSLRNSSKRHNSSSASTSPFPAGAASSPCRNQDPRLHGSHTAGNQIEVRCQALQVPAIAPHQG